ncbi:uncharacterized protein LOC111861613 isoform X2 [Cryptotermes secundus]|uniref:uncharacterized protein LOC111861613 isoform X2 n=1 Tax=Cryptotermes secundus TaxID=105785 RepID=UPI001454C6B8|nr:uncharacterized protein LOC111861613 isoform X2 [Cryptotermes secundus]
MMMNLASWSKQFECGLLLWVWAGTTEKVLFAMVNDTLWCEVSKEHSHYMSPVRSLSFYQVRSTEDPFPSHSYCTPIMRWPCSEGTSMEELQSQLAKDVIGCRLNKEVQGRALFPPFMLHCICNEDVSPGARSKESVKQRSFSNDVIVSGLNKEDLGRHQGGCWLQTQKGASERITTCLDENVCVDGEFAEARTIFQSNLLTSNLSYLYKLTVSP